MAADGVRVAVKLAPKASANAVDGIAPADKGTVLKIRVTTAPENGKANAALIGLLAGEWDLAASTIRLIGGATARNKWLHVAGDPAMLMARLDAWRRHRKF